MKVTATAGVFAGTTVLLVSLTTVVVTVVQEFVVVLVVVAAKTDIGASDTRASESAVAVRYEGILFIDTLVINFVNNLQKI